MYRSIKYSKIVFNYTIQQLLSFWPALLFLWISLDTCAMARIRTGGLKSGKISGHRFGIRLKYTQPPLCNVTYAPRRVLKRGRQIAAREGSCALINKVRKLRRDATWWRRRRESEDPSATSPVPIRLLSIIFLISIRETRERTISRTREINVAVKNLRFTIGRKKNKDRQ